MHVLVVVPAFNAEQFLEATLRSVLDQNYSDLSLVVVDNGSTDGTLEVAQRLENDATCLSVLRLEANVGPSAARNVGAASCSNWDAVLFLDADDVLLPGALDRLAQELRAHPECPAAYGNAELIDEAGMRIRPGELQAFTRARPWMSRRRLMMDTRSPTTSFASMVAWCPISTPGTVLIRREDFEQVGRWDPECGHCGDWDLWIRLSRRADLRFMDQEVLAYRKHSNAMSTDTDAVRRSVDLITRKTARSPENTDAQLRFIASGLRARSIHTAQLKYGYAREAAAQGKLVTALLQFQRGTRVSLLRVMKCLRGERAWMPR